MIEYNLQENHNLEISTLSLQRISKTSTFYI